MKSGMKYFTLFIFILILVTSCNQSAITDIPKFPIASSNINKDILILKMDSANTYRYGETIDFGVKNISTHKIKMDKDYGERIYVKKDGKWVEVSDGLISYSLSDVVLGNTENSNQYGVFGVNPVIPFESKNYEIIVFISGEMIDENGSPINKVGAYEFFRLRTK